MPCSSLPYVLFAINVFLMSPIRGERENCSAPCSCTYKGNTIDGLDCSNLKWNNIPPKFNFPSSAEHLSLANNRFTVLHNGTFRNLSKLQSLDISHNRLAVLEYSCFEGLESLLTLNISYNNLKMTTNVYAPGIFRYLENLKVLNIHGNIKQSTVDQNYPDVALSDLEFLEELTMDGLTRVIFGEGFRKLRFLTSLDMSVRDDESSCVLLDVLNITFSSLSNSTLSVLKLAQCNIYHIAPGAFAMLKHLTELDLSENDRLGFGGMKNASFGLHLTNIQILRLNRINRHIDPFTLKQKDFVYFNTTTIKTLTLDSNIITKIENGVIDFLPMSLVFLTFRDNYLTDVHFLVNLVRLNNLLVFDMSYQLNYHIRVKTDHESRNVRPIPLLYKGRKGVEKEEKSDEKYIIPLSKYVVRSQQVVKEPNEYQYNLLRSNSHQTDGVLRLPVNLQKIFGSNLKLNPLTAPPVTFDSNNSLEYLDLSSNGLHAWYGKWSGLHSLRFLNISFNAMFRLAPDTFGDMANLHTLLLNGNRLGITIMQDTQFLTFSNQTKLTYLNLSDNRLTDLPKFIFAKQINLEKLDLQENFLSAISFRMESLKRMREINLSNNTITDLTRVNMEEMDHLAKQSNFIIDLTGNPLKCTCDQLEQLRWMMVTEVVFRNLKHYKCKASNGSVVSLARLDDMVGQMDIDCIAGEVIIICVAVFCGLCLLLSLPALAYYKRSRLIYLFSVGRKFISPIGKNIQESEDEANDEHLKFTVYLSLEPSRSVNTFVSRFQVFMENKGVSICIPELDLIGGGKETVDIVKAINNSTCVLALINNDYMRSFHRLFEFEVAVTEGIQNRFNNLIVVLLEDLDNQHLQMNDFVSMYCLENHYFEVRRSWGNLFGELENEIIRYKEFTKKRP
ncbi:insulin-like growth factor-binding protein complex acid labile subunit [Mizuhopecten yessoensis]|uniref:insulin-like growth factor-binding protein complex acid labile subunit n=1 Tax=Mizuhopecten yessoensis TaxID=6573 RepID=UPI000B45C914|nr:insulin-like growth factor-binding protein complex acid labile subunit [Mizuhopecten yessoensis]XP_021373949.1 insulin-like growth factor-binding protein complex acid labile subunit [Mizuhopecten yessoensis]